MNAWTLTSAALQMAGKLTIYDAVMTLKPGFNSTRAMSLIRQYLKSLFQFIFQIIYD